MTDEEIALWILKRIARDSSAIRLQPEQFTVDCEWIVAGPDVMDLLRRLTEGR